MCVWFTRLQWKSLFPQFAAKTPAKQKFVQFDNVTGDTDRRPLSTYNLRPRKRKNLFKDESQAKKGLFSVSDQGQFIKGVPRNCVVLKWNQLSAVLSNATQTHPVSVSMLVFVLATARLVVVCLTQRSWNNPSACFSFCRQDHNTRVRKC